LSRERERSLTSSDFFRRPASARVSFMPPAMAAEKLRAAVDGDGEGDE